MRLAFIVGCLLIGGLFPSLARADDDDDKPGPADTPALAAPAGVFILDAATGKPAVIEHCTSTRRASTPSKATV